MPSHAHTLNVRLRLSVVQHRGSDISISRTRREQRFEDISDFRQGQASAGSAKNDGGGGLTGGDGERTLVEDTRR